MIPLTDVEPVQLAGGSWSRVLVSEKTVGGNASALGYSVFKPGTSTADLSHATDLIDLVRGVGDFSVGVAVHPEGHPASTDRATDRSRQAEKLAQADFGVSQFFFEPHVWFEFLDDLREQGVTTKVIPGIMPVLNVKSVKRMSEMAGAAFPDALEARLA